LEHTRKRKMPTRTYGGGGGEHSGGRRKRVCFEGRQRSRDKTSRGIRRRTAHEKKKQVDPPMNFKKKGPQMNWDVERSWESLSIEGGLMSYS